MVSQLNYAMKMANLLQATTHGDGFVGEDVTQNVSMVPDVPLELEAPFPKALEVRGEIVMSKKTLAKLNEQQAAEGQTTFYQILAMLPLVVFVSSIHQFRFASSQLFHTILQIFPMTLVQS